MNPLTQAYNTSLDKSLKDFVPPIITTTTPSDFAPSIKKLISPQNMWLSSTSEEDKQLGPSLATSSLTEAAASLDKKTLRIPMTKKEFSKLTTEQVYNNTIKTVVAITNDFGELISEKEMLSNTEFRRKLLGMFLLEDRRMYVGIVLILLSFIIYFIDTSA
jgi:hypothetical protein